MWTFLSLRLILQLYSLIMLCYKLANCILGYWGYANSTLSLQLSGLCEPTKLDYLSRDSKWYYLKTVFSLTIYQLVSTLVLWHRQDSFSKVQKCIVLFIWINFCGLSHKYYSEQIIALLFFLMTPSVAFSGSEPMMNWQEQYQQSDGFLEVPTYPESKVVHLL